MRKIDNYGSRLCNIQAEIFRQSLESEDCSSAVFIRRFMMSDYVLRMDKGSILFEAFSISDVLDDIRQQYGYTSYGKEKYSTEEMYWIGYIYRYWCYTYEISSKQVYRFIKPQDLRAVFFPYHSLDPSQAIERIIEARGLPVEDEIARGVRILRSIRSASKAR